MPEELWDLTACLNGDSLLDESFCENEIAVTTGEDRQRAKALSLRFAKSRLAVRGFARSRSEPFSIELFKEVSVFAQC